MDEQVPTRDEVLRMLTATAPPQVPDQAFIPEYPDLVACENWHRYTAAALVAGLQTDPRLHANGIRLDWLQRLVLSKAKGRRKPTRHDLSRALNIGMSKSGVTRLEDPAEDLFCELIVSEQGNFRIFAGQWENAGAYTQTLLDAFKALPDAPQKRVALASAYSLLRLSDEVARRAGVNRYSEFFRMPDDELDLPQTDDLLRMAKRVRFTDKELQELGIPDGALDPYVLEPELFRFVSDREIGDTPLEFHPLLKTPAGYVLASPPNVSLAVRAVLISTAKRGGVGTAFQYAILRQQEAYSHSGHFWPTHDLYLSPPSRFDMRAAVGQYAAGHFLQVIQIPGSFDDFPTRAFGSARSLSDSAEKFLNAQFEGFWDYTRKQSDCRRSASILLISGWGAGYRLIPRIDESKAPATWRLLALSFADAGVLGVVPDSKFADILRLLEQEDRLTADGFQFQNMNGILNLLGFWRTTGGNLIPEHVLDIRPPALIAMPTDELLAPRVEAVRRRDRQTVWRPDGSAKVVERMEWSDDEGVQSTYFNRDDIRELRLSAAILHDGRTWWLDSDTPPDDRSEWRYRFWHALLQWLDAVAPAVIDRFPSAFPTSPRRVSLQIPAARFFERIDIHIDDRSNIDATIPVTPTAEGGDVLVLPSWLPYLRLPDNEAELSLVTAVLSCLLQSDETGPSKAQLRSILLECVGSRDWRWLHAHEVMRAEDRLMASGLTGEFAAIPFSAHALAKCGSIWNFRDRAAGSEINGNEACQAFVIEYCDAMLESLIGDIRKFDRRRLCLMSAERYQNAGIEQSRWRNTIRALRAIRGRMADAAAFERQSAINGTRRAAKVIAEIAACEACAVRGKEPSSMELDDMFAKAVLIFGNSQLYSAILTDLIPPSLRISPAGDILSERQVLSDVLRPGVEWMNRRHLDEAAKAYQEQREAEQTEERKALHDGLRTALESEFRATADGFIDFQFAAIDLIQQRGEAVTAMKRSELAAWLRHHATYGPHASADHLERLTLPARGAWRELPAELQSSDIDLGRFDRPWSLINRPLLALDASSDPTVLVCPMWIADSTLYCLSGLMCGTLNDRFWMTDEARRYAGAQGKAAGDEFESSLASRLRDQGLTVIPRCKPSAVLNQKVPDEIGDIDALAVSPNGKRVWVIEAKNLRLCRTETEAVARMQEYRGRMVTTRAGRQRPDKMLRHLRRVQYLREHRERLPARLGLPSTPEVLGLLVVEAPQPMNFHSLESNPDARCIFLDKLAEFRF